MTGLLLRGCRLWGRDGQADVLVRDRLVAGVGGPFDDTDVDVVEVSGRVVIPGLVESHCHLDKTLYGGPWVPHSAGDALADRIGNDRRRRAELGIPDVDRITALLERMVAFGTTRVRSHTDIDPEVGLRGVQAVDEATQRLAGRVDVQQVAFPQHGVLTNPGTEALLADAIASGVEVVGAIDPAGMDRDPVGQLNAIFGIAERHGAMIDIHLHDGGSLGAWELELIADRTQALSMAGRVAVSHAYALGELPSSSQDRMAERLAAAGVAIVTAAVYDFPVAPVKKLRAAGVTVACGHDGIRDLWGPYGSGDMLERAMHLAYRSTFRRDDDIELALHAATHGGARLVGRHDIDLQPGAVADLVVVDALSAAEAVVLHPPGRIVVKRGQIVAGGAGGAG